MLERITSPSILLTLLFARFGSQAHPAPKGGFLRERFAMETFIHRETVALFKKVSRNCAPTRSETYA
jgi:hypothetical protein